jgi:hypothetical protein
VLKYYVLIKNKMQLLRLKRLPCGDLGIINVYAPNNLIDRRNVWEAIKKEVSRDYFWLFCGDLNMVEGKDDTSSFYGNVKGVG